MPTASNPVLLPRPRSFRAVDGALRLTGRWSVEFHCDAPEEIRATLPRSGIIASESGNGNKLVIATGPGCGDHSQGYSLRILPEGVTIKARDAAGAFYGVMTLRQILRQFQTVLPACVIDDWPDFSNRGVMLDIRRDKVPTMDTLFALVEELAEWKINHLELYTEHTFAYCNHREVWANASPTTAEEIRALDEYCRDRFIELVPNQQSFGHMHRWLQHPRYRPLALRPEEPYSLDPGNPKSILLLRELYSELLPNFASRKFNVGCDETIDLNDESGRVYLGFLQKINDIVRQQGRTIHFWGDIILQHPDLVAELPRDVVALEWGYEAEHPFDEHCSLFERSGVPFYVCPGTSSWNSIAGRTDNCLANLRSAAANGLRYGAVGYLNTDWGDNGHWQYLPVSYFGFAAGAALSWNYDANSGENFVEAIDLHVFRDSAKVTGELACAIGNAHLLTNCTKRNSSALFHLLFQPESRYIFQDVDEDALQSTRAHIQSLIETLPRAKIGRPDGDTVRAEFGNAARMMIHACNRAIAVRRGRKTAELADEIRAIIDEHRGLWLARNRAGGLEDSLRVLKLRLKEYGQST